MGCVVALQRLAAQSGEGGEADVGGSEPLRDLLKMSIEQARRAFDTFGRFERKGLEVARDSSQSARSSLQLLNAKIAEITRANAEANFALAIACREHGRGPGHGAAEQQVRKQMDNFVHQLEEMRDLTTKIIQDANPAKTDIGDALTVRNQARCRAAAAPRPFPREAAATRRAVRAAIRPLRRSSRDRG